MKSTIYFAIPFGPCRKGVHCKSCESNALQYAKGKVRASLNLSRLSSDLKITVKAPSWKLWVDQFWVARMTGPSEKVNLAKKYLPTDS